MLYQLEGSQAIAKAVAMCRPKIVCAYPITPQTHIVEELGMLVRSGGLQNCDFINVESEMAALSVCIGSQAAGVRSYTATSSQGLLYMMEAVYNASGLELPILMTIGNRAIGSPINIWNDHTDVMAARDAGWLMLFAETNQEAADLHIQAFRIAELVKCPIMVCVDGFVLTHAYERVDIPSQEEIDNFLPPYEAQVAIGVENPVAIGAMVPPEHFMEVRYLANKKQMEAVTIIESVGEKFYNEFGRDSGGLFHKYNLQDAEVIIVTMGSVAGTIKDAVDELNMENSSKFGVLSIVSYRPFPEKAIRNALKHAKRVIVVEKAMAVGVGGILAREIELSLLNTGVGVVTVIAGLGGKAITKSMLRECFLKEVYGPITFLGINYDTVEREYHPIGDNYYG